MLLKTSTLLKQSLTILRERLWTLVGLTALPFIFSWIFIALAFAAGLLLNLFEINEVFYSIIFFLIVLIFIVLSFIINLWAQVSLLYAVKERTNIRQALILGKGKIVSYLWISILVGIITIIGFILFIIPGIIFSIWFTFSVYVLVSEDLKGTKALSRSKELVKGYWFKVFWRLIVLTLIILLITLPIGLISIINSLGGDHITETASGFLSAILGFFVTPFSIIFSFLIFENLKKIKTVS